MTKLLKLLLVAYLRKVSFVLAISIVATLAIKFVAAESSFSHGLIFSGVYVLISLSMLFVENPFKSNLSWLLTTSSSRSNIIWANFSYRLTQLFFIYLVPGLVLGMEFLLFNNSTSATPELLREDQTLFHFHHLSSSILILITLFAILNISFLFSLGQNPNHSWRKSHKNSIMASITILVTFMVMEYYNFSSLIVGPIVSIFIFSGVMLQFKNYNLLPKIKAPQVISLSFAIAFVYFASMKFYSDQLINSPRLSLELRIDEINFQNKLGGFLDSKKLAEILRNPVEYNRLRPLVLNFPQQQELKTILKTEIETTFRSIIETKKDWTSVEFMLGFYDAADLKEKEISMVLDHLKLIEPKREKLSPKLNRWFEKAQVKRHDLLNFLASSNPLKQYFAVSMARFGNMDLQSEILKNIDHFSNPTLELVGKILSKNNCRTISSVDLFKASSKRQYQFPSDCKKVKVD